MVTAEQLGQALALLMEASFFMGCAGYAFGAMVHAITNWALWRTTGYVARRDAALRKG